MQITPTQRLAQILAFAGTAPFIVGAFVLLLAPHLGINAYRPLALQAITTYAAIIVSFLGGIQWGIGISTHEQQPQTARSLFLLSVVPSLLAWAMLFLPVSTSRIVVAIFFGWLRLDY